MASRAYKALTAALLLTAMHDMVVRPTLAARVHLDEHSNTEIYEEATTHEHMTMNATASTKSCMMDISHLRCCARGGCKDSGLSPCSETANAGCTRGIQIFGGNKCHCQAGHCWDDALQMCVKDFWEGPRPLWHAEQQVEEADKQGLPPFVQATIRTPARLYGYDVGWSGSQEWLVSSRVLEKYKLWFGRCEQTVAVGYSRVAVITALAIQFLESPEIDFAPGIAVAKLKGMPCTIIPYNDDQAVPVDDVGPIDDVAEKVFAQLGFHEDHSMGYVMALNGFLLGYAKNTEHDKGVMADFSVNQVCTDKGINDASSVLSREEVQSMMKQNHLP